MDPRMCCQRITDLVQRPRPHFYADERICRKPHQLQIGDCRYSNPSFVYKTLHSSTDRRGTGLQFSSDRPPALGCILLQFPDQTIIELIRHAHSLYFLQRPTPGDRHFESPVIANCLSSLVIRSAKKYRFQAQQRYNTTVRRVSMSILCAQFIAQCAP